MEDEKERDSFAEGMDVDLVVQDELLAGGCDPPFSEVIEGAQGSSHIQQTETALSSEDIALAPSQQADVPFDLGRLSRDQESARREVLDLGAGSLSSIKTKSAEQLGATPKTRQVTSRKRKWSTPEIESMFSKMEKLNIEDATGSEQPSGHNSPTEESRTPCCKEDQGSTQKDASNAFRYFDLITKWATARYVKKHGVTLVIYNILRKHSKCIEVTNLDEDVKMQLAKSYLTHLMPYCGELLDNILSLSKEINKLIKDIPVEREYAVKLTEDIIHFTEKHTFISSKMKELCDNCICARMKYLKEVITAIQELIVDSKKATKHLEEYRKIHSSMKRRDSETIEVATCVDSHWGQIVSPLRLVTTSADKNLPGASGASFSQDDSSDRPSPDKRRRLSINQEDGASQNRRKKHRIRRK